MSDTPSNVSTLPEGKVHMNVDALERDEHHDVFAVNLGGRRIEFKDPAELDWKELLEIDNPVMFFRYCLSTDDKAYFREQKIEGWRLQKIISAFQQHYNLETGKAGV